MDRDHPLTLELASLRQAVDKYQHAAHQSGIQLQGSRLECTLLLDRLKRLEHSTQLLATELSVLRANPPPPDPAPAEASLKSLTLAHRKLSSLLTLTEADLASSRAVESNAVAYRIRAEMELEKLRAGDLNAKGRKERVRGGEEEELMEGVDSGESQPEGEEVPGGSVPTSAAFACLQSDLARTRSDLANERTLRLAAQLELDSRSRDDRSAASVVERYMAFSQTSSLTLHASLQTLRTRHAATLQTLEVQLAEEGKNLERETRRAEGLMARIGEIGEEVGREREGRRREVGLRLASMAREERLLEILRRWQHKADSALQRTTSSFPLSSPISPSLLSPLSPSSSPSSPSSSQSSPELSVIHQLLLEASTLLDSSPLSLAEDWLSDDGKKVLLSEELCSRLVMELKVETELRRLAERERRELLGDTVQEETKAHSSREKALPSIPPSAPPRPSSPLVSPTDLESPSTVPSKSLAGPSLSVMPLLEPITSLAASAPFQQPLPPPIPPHPLTLILQSLSTQHEPLQRSFLTLHNSLQSLIQSLSPTFLPAPIDIIPLPHPHPHYLLALSRLDDICEDARVELEIALDDQTRLAEGYLMALTILDSPASVVGGLAKDAERERLEREIEAFIGDRRGDGGGGTQEGRKKDLGRVFGKRLEDLEHDLAVLKASLDNLSLDEPTLLPSNPSSFSSPALTPSPSYLGGFPSSSPLYRLSSSFSGHAHPSTSGSVTPITAPSPLSRLTLRNPMPASIHAPSLSSQPFPTGRSQSLTPSPSFGSKRPSFASLGRLFGGSSSGSIGGGRRRESEGGWRDVAGLEASTGRPRLESDGKEDQEEEGDLD